MASAGILGRLRATSIRKGVFGTSRAWLAVAAVTWTARAARKLVAKEERLVLREELKPGESLVITHTSTTRSELE